MREPLTRALQDDPHALRCPVCQHDGRPTQQGPRAGFRYLESLTVFRAVLAARDGEIVVRDLAEIDGATRLIREPLLQCRACLATFPLAPGTVVRVAGPQACSSS